MAFVDHTSGSYYDSDDALKRRLKVDKMVADAHNHEVIHDMDSGETWLATPDECKKIWPGKGWPPKGTLLKISPASKYPRFEYIKTRMKALPEDDALIVKSTGYGFVGMGNKYFSFDAEVMTNDGWIMDDEGPESRAFVFDTMRSSKYKIIYNPNIPYR